MRNKKAIKCIELLESIKINPERALIQRLDYVIECIRQEIMKNEFRQAAIKHSIEMKGSDVSSTIGEI